MVNRFYPAVGLILLATLICVSPTQSASAMTAEQYFADANRLFRDDLYWAALLRYRQAADEGMNTPLLHYNMGVSHYRAGQHIRARDALTRALGDPSLRVVTHYNLGLNAYELGELDEALRWFRLARDQETNKRVQSYAVVAISRIRDQQAIPDEFQLRLAEREKKRDFSDLQLSVTVGFGNDDNVFRTPDQMYVDLADPAAPTINPVIKSGAYMPIKLGAKYKVNSLKFEGFYVAYRLSGRYYQDKELENGNEYQHEASFGSEYQRKEGDRERKVFSAFKVSQHQESYYDPDDGTIRNVNGVDIEDRLDYLRYGPEITLRQSHKRLAVSAKFKGQLWNYSEQQAVPEYDHEYFLLSLYGQYKLAPTSLFRVTLEGYSRRFGDRPAFDLDGQQRVGNPNIRYDYYSLELTARQRAFDSLWFGFNVKHTERLDKYVGYNDYRRDTFSIDIRWSPFERFDFAAEGAFSLYDFPSALAFHNAAAPRKSQETATARVKAEFRLTKRFSLVADAQYREIVSNDTRIQYERRQMNIGVRWQQ